MSFGILASSHAPFAAASYAATVLADSPEVYLRLGDASGTTPTDTSGNSRSAAFVRDGAATYPAWGATGLIAGDADTALTFTATDASGIQISEGAAWQNVSSVTVEAWIDTTYASFPASVATRWNPDVTAEQCWLLDMNTGGVLRGVIRNSSNVSKIVSGGTINDGNPHHVAMTYDGSVLRLYVDGSQVDSLTESFTMRTATGGNGIGVGCRVGDTTIVQNRITAVIDEFAFYGTALSAARIAAHYNAGAA